MHRQTARGQGQEGQPRHRGPSGRPGSQAPAEIYHQHAGDHCEIGGSVSKYCSPDTCVLSLQAVFGRNDRIRCADHSIKAVREKGRDLLRQLRGAGDRGGDFRTQDTLIWQYTVIHVLQGLFVDVSVRYSPPM